LNANKSIETEIDGVDELVFELYKADKKILNVLLEAIKPLKAKKLYF